MTLAAGARLGPYEILSPLGAGGMGEVYRARDRKLERYVAIKVLPESVAADPDTLARFEREAKAVAALSHQNILAIFDFGDQDGVAYAVMELLEGETLRAKLDAGPIPQRQAVDYALQVVKGLSAAHEKGIVHRDLKPENLFISRDGHLKILDFGLAKRVEAVAPGQETSAPTGSGHTQPGVVMGTMGYMSPEQVKGLPVDHRSDIFSFGVILFELLSGRKAFRRETNAETMAAILRDEPPDLSESGRNVSPALERVVRHCLEKDRDQRFQSARDIAFNLSDPSPPAEASSAPKVAVPPGPSGFRIAVLPFKCGTSDADMLALADGMSEEVVSGLSRFRYLSVVANASADGAWYVVEGSLRRGGSDLRVTAQLVDTQTGARLWSETYRRNLQAAGLFKVQDDVAGRIVATVADGYGVLVHSIRTASREKDDADLTPVEWQFQYFAYREQISPSSHEALRSRLQRVAERNDRQSDVWACLAQIYVDEYSFGFGADATSLDRALAAARRAVELDRANQFALVALAQVHFFRQDLGAFGPAAERAMALNPLNTDAVGILGLQIVHTGEFERGAAIVRRAMELNPNHAGWMHFAPLWEHFHKGEYEQALERANRVDVPGHFWPFLVVASACGHLGRRAEAESAVRDLLALDPEFAAHVRSNVGTWHFASGLMEPILEGLRKAGLEIPAEDGSAPAREAATSSGRIASGAVRADEGFWVAVLPFKYGGGDASLTALAEGLSEEIATGLSRFSYLKVISRSSTVDSRSAGQQLGARYVMEGSLRQAGAKLRLAVQLVDTISGAHLWAENFERTFTPETVFDLQDDLVPRIVSTVADMHGVLPRSMSEVVRLKAADQMSPYEALLRSFGYNERFTPEDLAEVRTCLERAVQQAPGNAECWAMLSVMYANEYGHWDSAAPDSLDRSLRAARTAVEAAPLHSLPYYALAQALFFKREIPAFRVAAERAVSLNPMDGATSAFMGLLIAYAGDWERGCALSENGSQLNPNHPGWYRYTAWHDAYRKKDYRTALDVALRLNAPQNYYTHAVLAMCYAQLGQMKEARKALADMLALKPNYAQVARELHGRWIEPDLVEQLMDGLRKAGLEIGDKAGASPAVRASDSGAVRADEGFWIAVLPFKCAGTDASLTALTDGLTDEIATGLSRFSYLRVVARSSTATFSGESGDVRKIGEELGARYVMGGTLRQVGSKLRLAVQLVDTVSGAHLWAESFERAFRPESLFELQDDLVPRIVSTVADMAGVLPRSMSESLRSRPPEQLSPYEAVLRSFGYFERYNPEELAAARSGLEAAVRKAPAYADAWAMLSYLCAQDYVHGYDLQPGALEAAASAARRAVELGPSNHLSWFSLAQSLSYQKDFDSFRHAAERAVELNPMDGSSVALLGELLIYAGSADRGMQLAERAKRLNPIHAGGYYYADFYDAFSRGDYRGALDFALKSKLRGNPLAPMFIAAASGQLGEADQGSKAVRDLLRFRPELPALMRKQVAKIWNPEYSERFLAGLSKAGLQIPEVGSPASRTTIVDSGEMRADEGFWVAVLPFKHGGADASLTALAEGLTEEIVTGLSRFSYLKVIAHGATADGRSARDLGARYVMEGSLRQAGARLRVAVQLVDAASGAHLWAENYERPFSPDAIFELQDELVPRIVSTVADMHGILPRTMSDALRGRAPETLSPYEAVLRSFGYFARVTREELAVARAGLELAVAKAPDLADAWAMLALLCVQDYGQGFDLQVDSLSRGLSAARRAVEAAPSNPLAAFSLAQALFFQKEFEGFRNVAQRAAALNPMDGNAIAFLGELLTYAGDSERGLALAARAKQLNPNHPGWYWYADFYDAYRRGDDRRAISVLHKVNLPGHWGAHAAMAAACGQLGDRDAAAKALRDLLALRPDFATTLHEQIEKWWEPEYGERMIDGLRKAGLEIPEPARAGPAGNPAAVVGIAVLPFSDMSPARDQEYLCEGMAEEIMNALVRIEGIRIASRTSAFRAGRDGGDLATIARTLSVGHVLEGSVRTSGSRLRVTAQLTEAASGYQLWSERFDRNAADIFAVQDEIAAGVVSAVKSRLAPGTGALPARPQPRNLDAYRAYLRGRHLRGIEDHAGALRAFEEAVRLDPSLAPAWTGLAEITVLSAHFSIIPAREACAAARKALAAAEALQGESAEGLHVEAFAAFIERRWDAMDAAWRRALELEPRHVLALGSYGITLCARGRPDEGLALCERAREADPLASFPYTLTAWGLLLLGKPQEALRYAEDALGFEKEDASALVAASMANVALGRFAEGIAAAEKGVAISHRGPAFLGGLGWALASAGRREEARVLLEELRARPDASPTTVSEVWILGALGEIDEAFAVIARAEEECQGQLYYTGLPGFDALRSDPRFTALERRLGLSAA